MADLLLVDDEPMVADGFARYLERAGHTVRRATTGESAVAAWRARRPDVTLLDVQLPDMTGFDVYARIREEHPVVIMISGHADIPLAVRAVQEGVEHFLTKPVELSHLGVAIERALERVQLRQLSRYLTTRRSIGGKLAIGSSPATHDLAARVQLAAVSDHATVLLLGESGTGKGRVAELIHARSPRAHGAFVAVRCTGASACALELELFGGDDPALGTAQPGLIEVASGGTLFLDEIGVLAPSLQLKLLRLLETRSMRRVGGTRDIGVDVRIVAATTQDLASEVTAGRFREALYYRLGVMPLALPPLRSRSREDLVALIAALIDELAPQLPSPPRELSEPALDALLRYPWPGNLRELRNVLERGLIVSRGAVRLDIDALPPEVRGDDDANEGGIRLDGRTLDEVARLHIERTLRLHQGNRTHASRALGISRATLIKKIKEFGLAE